MKYTKSFAVESWWLYFKKHKLKSTTRFFVNGILDEEKDDWVPRRFVLVQDKGIEVGSGKGMTPCEPHNYELIASLVYSRLRKRDFSHSDQESQRVEEQSCLLTDQGLRYRISGDLALGQGRRVLRSKYPDINYGSNPWNH